jgi:acetyl esterase/lipase
MVASADQLFDRTHVLVFCQTMNHKLLSFVAAIFLTHLSCSRDSILFADAAEPKPPQGFQAIFNGKDLEGWYGLNPHDLAELKGEQKETAAAKMRAEFAKHWRVEKGDLVNDGTGPYATTETEFENYELRLLYKTVAGADSGIYLRGVPQVQIWDSSKPHDDRQPDWHPYFGSGGLFNNTPRTLGRDPLFRADKSFGQWNEFVIRHVGNRVWVKLNNREVVTGVVLENYWDRSQALPTKGPLMLQTHGGEIRWRDIFVREIPPPEAKRLLATKTTPNPTHYNVSYGSHHKQKLHFWQAESKEPTPVLLFIHGGGWLNGGRLNGLVDLLPKMLDSGISVASVEYRFIPEATKDGVVPPVKGPLDDAARALQYVRSQAKQWNIDKTRIAASGGSAGACSSLWLAFHDDLADPNSDDPISHESTRLTCAAVFDAQTTLDPKQMREWTPNSNYGGHAFGFKGDPRAKISQFQEFFDKRDSITNWIAEYSPYALVTSEDPPVYLFYKQPPAIGKVEKDPTHTANFGVKLQEHCQANRVECELVYPGVTDAKHATTADYLIEKLLK